MTDRYLALTSRVFRLCILFQRVLAVKISSTICAITQTKVWEDWVELFLQLLQSSYPGKGPDFYMQGYTQCYTHTFSRTMPLAWEEPWKGLAFQRVPK